MSLFIPAFITIVCFLYYYFTRTFNYWKSKNVKGPKPIPFFGNYKDVFLRTKHAGMLYNELYKQYPNEKVVGIYRMTAPTLLIRDLDIVKQVLIKDFDSFPDRGLYYSQERLGSNLFHGDLQVTKTLRHHFTTTFTASKFKNNFPLLSKQGDKFIEYIDNVTLKESEIDVLKVFRRYTVDSIMMGAYGIDADLYNEENHLSDFMNTEIQTPNYFIEMELLFPGILTMLNMSVFSEKVYKFFKEIVQAGVNNANLIKAQKKNSMDVLLGLRQEGIAVSKTTESKEEFRLKITDDILTAQAFILYFAGYGNNALLLTFAMYHLANNPDKQEILIREIDEVLRRHDENFTYDALKEMKYLQMVFDETMRMHPTTNGITRNASHDIQIEGTDFVINKGTLVVISPYAVQHDEKYYPEPEKFKPERFSPENVREQHPCSMLSFGLGPRTCLGSRFSHCQFGICIVKVFSKFRVETTKNTINSINYTPWRLLLTPSETIHLRLVPRNK